MTRVSSKSVKLTLKIGAVLKALIASLIVSIFDLSGFIVNVILGVFWAYAIFCFLQKEVFYDKENVYFGKRKYPYKAVVKFNTFDFNNIPYYYFKTSDGKWHFTILGNFSLWGLIKTLFGKRDKKFEQFEHFLSLLKEKSSI